MSSNLVKYLKPLISFASLFIPVLVLFVTGLFFLEIDFYDLKFIIIENFFSGFVMFTAIVLIPVSKFTKKLLFYFSYFILAFSVFIQVSYFKLFTNKISSSTFYIILETNLTETLEFLSAYFNYFNLLVLIILSVPFLIIKHLFFCRFNRYWNTGILIGILLSLYFYFSLGLKKHNFYSLAWQSFIEYEDQKSMYKKFALDRKMGSFNDVTDLKESEKKTYVLVLGESTTRHRMGLYNYDRNTNPLLSSLSNKLSVYSDVISPHTHTIASLSKVLSLANQENSENIGKGSIIQLMNQAGFKTFWISNQKPIGWNETLISIMASAAHETYFPNPNAGYQDTAFDGKLLPIFIKALQDKANKKFIVIHLLGTHLDYEKRYPKSFEKFSSKPPLTITENEEALKNVNNYDNAILYNDKVIYDLISALNISQVNSWLIYTSDHGEDVFQVNNSFGHTESKGTYPMYDVPFLLWRSDSFRKFTNFKIDTSRAYMLDDLIYSISDLSGVHFKGFEDERSIFNENYKVRERKVSDNQIYDSIKRK